MAKILIFAATGKVGTALSNILVAQGHEVHGVTRGGAGLDRLSKTGVTPVIADVGTISDLAEKITGFDAVFLASADAPDQGTQESAIIDLLAESGNSHVVKLSAQSAGLEPPVSFGKQHYASELSVAKSGLTHTILRPTFFQQSILLMKEDVAKKATITAPMGKGKSAMVNVDDIAAVAAHCLTNPKHHNKTYTLTGPEAIGLHEVVELLSQLLDRKIKYISPPAPIARVVMPFLTGMPRWQTSLIVDLMVAIRNGAQATITSDVEMVTGNRPGNIVDFLDKYKSEFTIQDRADD